MREELLKGLSKQQLEKASKCKNEKELLALAREEGVELTEEQLIQGAKAIYNKAYGDAGEPSTQSLEELEFVNEQNTTNFKKNKLNAYSELLFLLKTK